MPSFMPILHQSLQFIDCYSLSLHRFSASIGLGLPSYRPIIHQSLHLIGFYSSSLRKFASTGGLGLPSFMPILHLLLQFTNCYIPSLRRFSQVSGSDCPLFKAYRVNIAPYYLFTLKILFIAENCTTFVCLFDLFSPRLSISKYT